MNLNEKRYVILELIPTKSKDGEIAQISALKLNGLKLEKRFDYRLDKSLIKIPELLNMLNYDNEAFKYAKTTKKIMDNFKRFIEDLPLLIIDNDYTKEYLKDIKNEKISVFSYFDIEVSYEAFEKLIEKYNLEPSDHYVDLLYEALIKEL